MRFAGLPAKQGVLIVYPHTSNWDFLVGVLAKWTIGLPVTFWGKASLFALPLLGRWLRWLGGVPVERTGAHGSVAQMVAALRAARAADRFMWLALSPEGTRRYAPGWRSGFYHVALQAGVPVGLVSLDYRQREVGVRRFVALSGDRAADLAAIGRALGASLGRHAQGAAPIRFESS